MIGLDGIELDCSVLKRGGIRLSSIIVSTITSSSWGARNETSDDARDSTSQSDSSGCGSSGNGPSNGRAGEFARLPGIVSSLVFTGVVGLDGNTSIPWSILEFRDPCSDSCSSLWPGCDNAAALLEGLINRERDVMGRTAPWKDER